MEHKLLKSPEETKNEYKPSSQKSSDTNNVKAILVFHGLGSSCRDKVVTDKNNNKRTRIGIITTFKHHFSQKPEFKDVPIIGISSGKSTLTNTTDRLSSTVKRGVRKFLNDHQDIISKEVLLIGFSMGAHAVLSLASEPEFAKENGFWGAISISPPTSAYQHIDVDNKYGEKSALAELLDSCGLQDFLKDSLNSSKLMMKENPLHTHTSLVFDARDKHLLKDPNKLTEYTKGLHEIFDKNMDESINGSCMFFMISTEGKHQLTEEKMHYVDRSIEKINNIPKTKKYTDKTDDSKKQSSTNFLDSLSKIYEEILYPSGYYSSSEAGSEINHPLHGIKRSR